MWCNWWLRELSISLWTASCVLAQQQGDQILLGPDSAVASAGSQRGSLAGKKNIVFILTDDQDAVLDSVSYMPLLHKHIIKMGTSFANHFTTTAICCPSRVALWTGKQPHNTNVTDVSPPYGMHRSLISPAQHLK